jgi:indole-3-glycerol phosphate synthase
VGILERILASKREAIERLEMPDFPVSVPRRPALRRPGSLALIAEIKRRSPSAGALSTRLDVTERARAYATAGAAMISVLCDHDYFDGSYAHLPLARAGGELPILCKDFIIDERQLAAARAWGADAALIIVRCLSGAQTADLVAAARARELVPLVEITTDAEARIALDAGADLIGVNARDLDTLQMDGVRAQRVLDSLPDHVIRVRLSGLESAQDVSATAATAADAALIGEALMRQDDPTPLLREMVSASRKPPLSNQAR